MTGHEQAPEQAAPEQGQRFAAEIATACDKTIETYRRGEVSKPDAVDAIMEILRVGEPGDEALIAIRRSALISYLGDLDEVDREHRGRTVSPPRSPPANGSPSQTQSTGAASRPQQQGLSGLSGGAPAQSGQTQSGGAVGSGEPTRTGKRKRGHGGKKKGRRSRGSSSSGSSSEEEENGTLNENLVPFLHGGRAFKIPGASPVESTLVLKENYLRDLTRAKHLAVCHPGRPEIPDGLWNDFLASRFVDFDKLFSSIYAIDGDQREKHRVGDLEITTGSAKASRHVRGHGDWTLAWNLYREGVTFTYPHREPELQRYYEHITGVFAALPEDQKPRAIFYDRAIRSLVARSNTKLLTDFGDFNSLYTMHIHTAGSSTTGSTAGSQGNRARNKQRAPCIRWNQGRCPDETRCRFRHVCSQCKSAGHTAPQCTAA